MQHLWNLLDENHPLRENMPRVHQTSIYRQGMRPHVQVKKAPPPLPSSILPAPKTRIVRTGNGVQEHTTYPDGSTIVNQLQQPGTEPAQVRVLRRTENGVQMLCKVPGTEPLAGWACEICGQLLGNKQQYEDHFEWKMHRKAVKKMQKKAKKKQASAPTTTQCTFECAETAEWENHTHLCAIHRDMSEESQAFRASLWKRPYQPCRHRCTHCEEDPNPANANFLKGLCVPSNARGSQEA